MHARLGAMTDGTSQRPQRAAHETVALLLLALGLAFALSPWQIVDHDALIRLAVGRSVAAHGGPPLSDPFTFRAPHQVWCNPEWLGDLLWWTAYRLGGLQAVVGLKHGLLALAFALVGLLARRLGATLPWIALVLCAGGLAAAERFTVRNYLHAYWLLPLYGHLLLSARDRPRLIWPTLPLAWLWANLHSSFVLSWILVAAYMADQWAHRKNLRGADLVVFGVHPLIPFCGPFGWHAYDQLIDHARGAEVYGQLILEWQQNSSGDRWGVPAFHLLALAGLLSFLLRENRQQLGGALLLGVALAFGYRAQRFAPLLLFMAGAVVATNLSRLTFTRRLNARGVSREPNETGRSGQGNAEKPVDGPPSLRPGVGWRPVQDFRRRQLGPLAGTGIAAILAICTAGIGLSLKRLALDVRPGPQAVARFAAALAAPGAHTFNPFNAGAHLLWLACPPLKLYLDPRNNLGHAALRDYVEKVLPNPGAFDALAARLDLELALVHTRLPRFDGLARHLGRSKQWHLLFFDGRYALYARREAKRAAHYQPQWLEALRPSLDLDYLSRVAPDALTRDLKRLSAFSPALVSVVQGVRLLNRPTLEQSEAERAATLLQQGMRGLPASPALLGYLASAWKRSGKQREAQELIKSGLGAFPRSKRLHELAEAFRR